LQTHHFCRTWPDGGGCGSKSCRRGRTWEFRTLLSQEGPIHAQGHHRGSRLPAALRRAVRPGRRSHIRDVPRLPARGEAQSAKGFFDPVLNELKNRDVAPASTADRTIAEILANKPKSVVGEGKTERAKWSQEARDAVAEWEATGARAEGRLIAIRVQSPESCNCHKPNDLDMHLWIAAKAASTEKPRAVVIEISPRNLALLEKINISVPERALRVGIATFTLRFVGDTFSFRVDAYTGVFDYFEEIARGLESARRVRENVTHEHPAGDEARDGSPREAADLFYGPSYSGMQLLDMFHEELLGRRSSEQKKSRATAGFSGLVGEKGRAITFYPSIPESFQHSSEAENYRFTIPGLPMVRSAQRIAILRKKLLGKPSDVTLYLELAACLWIEGRHVEVVECPETAVAKVPANALVHRTLAHTLQQLGRIHDALDHVRISLALEPESANGQMLAGACFSALGDGGAALPFFEAAVRLEPEDGANQYNLCATLVRLQRYKDAIEPAQRLADLKPADPDSALHLGVLLDAQDLDEKAQYYLKKAIGLAPSSAEAHERLGMHFAKRHLHDEAVDSLLRAIGLHENAMRWDLVGRSYSALERWTEAEEAFRKAVAISPEDPALRVNLGVALANLDRVGEAKEQLAQILEDDPHHELATSTLRAIEEAAASE